MTEAAAGGRRGGGRHLLIDFEGAEGLGDPARVERALRAACAAAEATVIEVRLHRFGGEGGVSGVALLAESHMSIHTWPETGFAAIDVLLCGGSDPRRAAPALVEAFRPRRVSISEHRRGAP